MNYFLKKHNRLSKLAWLIGFLIFVLFAKLNEELIIKTKTGKTLGNLNRSMETQEWVNRPPEKGPGKTETIYTLRDNQGSGNTWEHIRDKLAHSKIGKQN